MRLVYNSNSTMHLPILMQARVARETGWDGIFVRAEHIRRYLDLGLPDADLRAAMAGFAPVNLGALADIERWVPDERRALLAEAEAVTAMAVRTGVTNVQLLSGPVAPGGAYDGPAGLSPSELRRVTADGIRAIADIGAAAGIRYYLEPIAWTALDLDVAVDAIDEAGRDNLGLVLDFWHLWQRGVTPDDIASLDRRVIAGVDFADSLGPQGDHGPDQRTRCVWPGDGEIPLARWVEAVLATGFDGWWDNELYSPPHWEQPDPFAVGRGLRTVLADLLPGSSAG